MLIGDRNSFVAFVIMFSRVPVIHVLLDGSHVVANSVLLEAAGPTTLGVLFHVGHAGG